MQNRISNGEKALQRHGSSDARVRLPRKVSLASTPEVNHPTGMIRRVSLKLKRSHFCCDKILLICGKLDRFRLTLEYIQHTNTEEIFEYSGVDNDQTLAS